MKENQAYEFIKKEELQDIKSIGYLLKHKKTGARLILIENEDENKVFNIGFRTPVSNSTGVPHIMEHSVLCGSKHFPVKDPFVELVKGSLNTFLNAMTYPDRTLYPVASCNDKDFQNLMHVYLDAVFYPNIYQREEIFRQEGWSYEMENKEDELKINGVVYNEMKGVFSSPDGVLERVILSSLYPDTSYGNESGGDPEVIPTLTYSQFLEFHRTFYHPSNSFIYLYGKMDLEEKLDWLDREYLGKFEPIQIDSVIKKQVPFTQARRIQKNYSLAEGENPENAAYLSYNVSIGDGQDVTLCIAFEILKYALLSSPGAPLKKALLEAKIGMEVVGNLDTELRDISLSIVAKNTQLEKEHQFLSVITDTLTKLCEEGLDQKALEAAMNTLEFQYREADFGRFPKGLMYSLQIFGNWIYEEENPFDYLACNKIFAWLRTQLTTGYFENLIRERILHNTHASIVVLVPQIGLTTKKEEELATALRKKKASLSEAEIEEIVVRTKDLKQYQDTPSAKEDLEKIPMLSREDIGKEAMRYPNEVREEEGTKVLFHNLYTNGIGYIGFLFLAENLTKEELQYASLLKNVLGFMDTQKHSYGAFANEVDFYTGGLSASISTYLNSQDSKVSHTVFEVSGKALYAKQDYLFSLTEEMLFQTKFSDTKRLYEILAEIKSRAQTQALSSGHTLAVMRALSYLSPGYREMDQTVGLEFFQFIEGLEKNFEEKKTEIQEKLALVAKKLFRKENFFINYTADEEGYKQMKTKISSLVEQFYKEDTASVKEKKTFAVQKKNEGFKTSSQVQYVARTGNFRNAGYKFSGAMRILTVIMNYEYMWLNIRVKGGAYGCMSGFLRNGDSYFVSYRDPHMDETNQIYEGIADYVEHFTVDERDMTKYIIGTISDLDIPLTPYSKGIRALGSYMMGVTYEMVQKEREEILFATQDTIRGLAPAIRAILEEEAVCVIGSEEAIVRSSILSEKRNLFEV